MNDLYVKITERTDHWYHTQYIDLYAGDTHVGRCQLYWDKTKYDSNDPPLFANAVYFSCFRIFDPYKGQGYGRHLFYVMLNMARNQGGSYVYWNCFPPHDSQIAYEFYQRHARQYDVNTFYVEF